MNAQPLLLRARQIPWYRWLAIPVLIGLTSVLLAELALIAPALSSWRPNDYFSYVYWGDELRQGHLHHNYPLPIVFWFFVPLSLLPSQFVIIWAIAPFLFVLWILGRKGLIMWLFFPLLVQTGYAQLEGWLIVPLAWVLENRPVWAAFGAMALLVKPTVAPLVILYALYRWLRTRDYRNLKWFSALAVLLVAPAFVIDPLWPIHFVLAIPGRTAEANMLPRGATLWTWGWHGGITLWLLPLVVLGVLGLALYVARRQTDQTPIAQVLSLLSVPSLYLATSTMLIPFLRTWREMVILVVVSWIGVLLDTLVGGWGGVYIIIPLAMLVLLARRPTPT